MIDYTAELSIVVPGRFGNRVEDVVVVDENGGVSIYQADHRLYLSESNLCHLLSAIIRV